MKRFLISLLAVALSGCVAIPVKTDDLYHDGEVIKGPPQSYSKTHGVNFGVPPGWEGKMEQWEAAGRPPFAPEDIPADWRK